MMKAIMYHYVRPAPMDMPWFRYLHVDSFVKQLDYFAQTYGFVSREAYREAITQGRPSPGVVLTFDDGLIDHYHYVLPILAERKLWGIFYIPTGMYSSGKLLDVHRVHVLLGRYGGEAMLENLYRIVSEEMLSHRHVEAFRAQTYTRQDNDEPTTLFKRILNYYIAGAHQTPVLDQLMETYVPEEGELCRAYYVNQAHIRALLDHGMMIGSHSVSHRVMSKLDVVEQRQEIEESIAYLQQSIDAPIESFCYPYGGFHSFTAETERLLQESGCRFSYNVESRDISSRDLSERPQALPRYDCNLFPHGRASIGSLAQ